MGWVWCWDGWISWVVWVYDWFIGSVQGSMCINVLLFTVAVLLAVVYLSASVNRWMKVPIYLPGLLMDSTVTASNDLLDIIITREEAVAPTVELMVCLGNSLYLGIIPIVRFTIPISKIKNLSDDIEVVDTENTEEVSKSYSIKNLDYPMITYIIIIKIKQ